MLCPACDVILYERVAFCRLFQTALFLYPVLLPCFAALLLSYAHLLLFLEFRNYLTFHFRIDMV